MTQQELNQYRREYRRRTNNAATHKYEKTKNGFLMRTYRNMLSRVTGVQKKKAHLYLGLHILDRIQFYQWALADDDFHMLFNNWELSDHKQAYTPSVNRIDASKGYELGNMEWITHSENSRRTRRWEFSN